MSREDATERLRRLVEAQEQDPSAPPDPDEGRLLAAAVGGDLAFRWRVLELRGLLLAPPQDDTVAERYGELLEEARNDPDRLAQVRPIGERLRAMQDAGELPRVMLARAPRRHRPQ